MRRAVLIAVLASVTASAAPADDLLGPNEQHWRVLLKDQLQSEKGCALNEVIAFHEVPLGEDVGLDGRVSCFDGREFNFTRKGKTHKFTIEICGPAVC